MLKKVISIVLIVCIMAGTFDILHAAELSSNVEQEVVEKSDIQTFSLPSVESEYWLPINIGSAGDSVDITIYSDAEDFEAPISYIFCKGKNTDNYIGEVGVSIPFETCRLLETK